MTSKHPPILRPLSLSIMAMQMGSMLLYMDLILYFLHIISLSYMVSKTAIHRTT